MSKKEEIILRYTHFNNTEKCNNHIQCNSSNKSLSEITYCNNYVSTTKYDVLTFIPKNLYLQFNKVANIYFLITAIISLFPIISPKPWWVSVAPLTFVLLVSAIKEGYEDIQRYKMDVTINNSNVKVYKDGQFSDILWADVQVGDMIKIIQDQAFPADILLLQSSNNNGICNIETANLDGETNLKVKKARTQTYNINCNADGEDYPTKFKGILESDPPTESMESSGWKGVLHKVPNTDEPIPLSMEQLLLRGCVLRNTKWIIGIVAFTGRETKLMLNNKATVFKRSQVELAVDVSLYFIFALDAFLCVFGAVANYIWMKNNASSQWYLPFNLSNIDISNNAALSFLTYLVLLDVLVPISLYISMELVKVVQVILIDNDLDMYHEETDTPAKARTSNLNEELGQINYIFSDKTGTLTRNMMEFMRCTVRYNNFGPGRMEEVKDIVDRLPPASGIPKFAPNYRFEDNRLCNWSANKNHHENFMCNEFLTLLSCCHAVIAEYNGCKLDGKTNPDGKPHIHGLHECTSKCTYQAASPDDKALVDAAKELQYFFKYRTVINLSIGGVEIDDAQLIQVNIHGEIREFEILALLDFTSARKRMSVVLRDRKDGSIKLYTKGADTIIYELLNKDSKEEVWNYTFEQLEGFAKVGLRTLVCAMKTIPEAEFIKWYKQLKSARADMNNRSGMVIVAEQAMEHSLVLIGSTAIEDRLQEGVPECIENLAKAGIKIWVLTGDKTETAINIGRSCNLLTDEMRGDRNLIIMDVDEKISVDLAREETERLLKDAWEIVKNHELGQEGQALVISGRALGFIFPIRKVDSRGDDIIPGADVLLYEEEMQMKLFNIATRCKAVVCCRVSPKQKAQVVMLVKERVSSVCLAIGDGANDVPMIKAAHVGVGISGQEGLQAVMASDYAIAQFKFLQNLLLIHGARSYRRISLLILYSFYKNVTISLTNMLFAFHSAFAGQLFYDPLCGSLFNMFFTAVPIMGAAVFNIPFSKRVALNHPTLYKSGQTNDFYNQPLFYKYVFEGFLHSFVIFFFSIFLFGVNSTDLNGLDNDQWVTSTAMFSYVVFVVNVKLALECVTWVIWTYIFFFGSLLMWFIWILGYTADTYTYNMLGVAERLFSMGVFWFGLFVVVCICIMPQIAYKYIQSTYYQTVEDLILTEISRKPNTIELVQIANNPMSSPALKAQLLADTKKENSDNLDSARIMESEIRLANWKRGHRNSDLGYCNFAESELNADFIMGQSEFLRNKLGNVKAQINVKPVAIKEERN